jgi:hypothetical protein
MSSINFFVCLALLCLLGQSCVSARKYHASQAALASARVDSVKLSASRDSAVQSYVTLTSAYGLQLQALEFQASQVHAIESQAASLQGQLFHLRDVVAQSFPQGGPFSGLFEQQKTKILNLPEWSTALGSVQQLQATLNYIRAEPVPTIFNPPPYPSAEAEIKVGTLTKSQKYVELGSKIKSIFEGSNEKAYFFRFDGGFACATLPKDYSVSGQELTDDQQAAENVRVDFLSAFFSRVRRYFDNLTTADPVYTRFYVLVVSNQFNSVNNKENGFSDFSGWFRTQRFELPTDIGIEIPSNTRFHLLLYEFKQEANTSVKNCYFGTDCQRHLTESSLFKALVK